MAMNDDDGSDHDFMVTLLMIMVVMIYFWYISNIIYLCTLPSASKIIYLKKKEDVMCPLLKAVNQTEWVFLW